MVKKVLIVDDNSTNLYMLETLLKGYGFEVTSAENGKDALNKARLNPPDLIVTDILMPVMDGYALCREWKSDDTLKHIPLVFYTATYTEPKDEEFALSLGADRFFIKPQEPDIFMNMLKDVLEEKYTARQAMTKPLGEEMEFFRRHDEIMFKKLEKKMSDLEIANQKLRISEERYRLSFENATDVIYTIDNDLNVLSVSPSVERILGYKPQDFIGRPVSALGYILTPESFEQIIGDISLVLKGEIMPATIYRFIAKDGTMKYGEVSGSPLMREGKIIGIISVARDITERKQAEEKVTKSEKKYRELYDFLPIPVYEMDLEANIVSANRAIYETFRGTEEDLKKGFKIWQTLSPEDIDKSNKNVQRLLKGQQIEGTEYTLMRLDGSVFPAIVISSVIYSDGKPVGLRGAIVDITERRQREEELRRINAFLDSIIENIPDMIFLKDVRELRFIRFNRAGEALLGHSRDDLLGKNDYDFFPKEQADLFTEKDREVLIGKEIVDIPEELIQTRNKGERVLHTKKVPILNANGELEYLLGISEDITERKLAEEALRFSNVILSTQQETTHDGILVVDPEGKIISYNKRLTDMWGIPSYVLETKSDELAIQSILHKLADPKQFLSEVRRLYDNINATSDDEIALVDGRVFDRHSAPMIGKDGKHYGRVWYFRDITERKRAEEALQESEERYRNVFENHAAVKFLIDPDTGSIIEANEAAVNYYGWSHEQLKQMKMEEINTLPPEEIKKEMEKARTEERVHFEFRHRRADGSIRDVEVFSSKINVRGKDILHSIVHDITERKQAEAALRESQKHTQFLADVLDRSDQPFAVGFPDGRIGEHNPAFCRLTGYTSEELRSMDWTRVLTPPEWFQAEMKALAKLESTGKPVRYEKEYIRKDGSRVPVELFTHMAKNARVDTEYYYAFITDITERKRAEDSLKKSEARFRSYFELPLIGIAITSPEKGWLEGNDRLSDILGYSWQELKDMTWSELTHPEDIDADVEQFNRVLAGEIDSYTMEKRFIRKNGDAIWTSLAAGCVRKHDGTVDYFVAVLEDITARKESSKRIRKTLGATIDAIATAVETRDPYTAGHQRRVSDLARAIATEMNLPTDKIEGMRMAAIIHDIGKISVPSEILTKPTKLTDLEFGIIKTHAQSGYDILKDIEFPWPIARIVLEHHERMDGSGYPKGLVAEETLLESRILCVADVVESMASHRPYRPSLGIESALKEIENNKGTLYDTGVVDACLRIFMDKGYQLIKQT